MQALCHCLHLIFITGPLQLTTSTVRISTISLPQLEKQVKRNAKSGWGEKTILKAKTPPHATAPKRAYSRAKRGKEGIRYYKSVKSFNRYLHFPTSGCRQQAGCSWPNAPPVGGVSKQEGTGSTGMNINERCKNK